MPVTLASKILTARTLGSMVQISLGADTSTIFLLSSIVLSRYKPFDGPIPPEVVIQTVLKIPSFEIQNENISEDLIRDS
jgi:hypothetical protein